MRQAKWSGGRLARRVTAAAGGRRSTYILIKSNCS